MKIECTCNGLNGNCYKCFGNGYYDKDEVNSKIEYANTPLYSHIKEKKFKIHKKSIQTNCPYCNICIGIKKLYKHIIDYHTTDGTIFKLKKCLKCGLVLPEHETKNHIMKFHFGKQNKKPIDNQIIVSVVKKIRNSKDNILEDKSYTNEVIHIDNENKKITASEINRRDGSKDWHIIRDNGKFGSYPVFEAMDDESLP